VPTAEVASGGQKSRLLLTAALRRAGCPDPALEEAYDSSLGRASTGSIMVHLPRE